MTAGSLVALVDRLRALPAETEWYGVLSQASSRNSAVPA
jgi:hypothetical protein